MGSQAERTAESVYVLHNCQGGWAAGWGPWCLCCQVVGAEPGTIGPPPPHTPTHAPTHPYLGPNARQCAELLHRLRIGHIPQAVQPGRPAPWLLQQRSHAAGDEFGPAWVAGVQVGGWMPCYWCGGSDVGEGKGGPTGAWCGGLVLQGSLQSKSCCSRVAVRAAAGRQQQQQLALSPSAACTSCASPPTCWLLPAPSRHTRSS